MILVYAVHGAGCDAVARALEGLAWSPVESPDELRAIAQSACAAVIAPGDLCESVVVGWLDALLQDLPHVRWILLCPFTPPTALRLLDLRGHADVIWSHEAEGALRRRLDDVLGEDVLVSIERTLADPRLPPELGSALMKACRLRRVPGTVEGLCRAVGIRESRLRYLWRGCLAEDTTPAQFVDWLLLGQATRFRSEAEPWKEVAGQLGVSERRLRAVWMRRMGRPPGHFGGTAASAMRSEFASWWTRARAG